jgi:hypothetical protein
MYLAGRQGQELSPPNIPTREDLSVPQPVPAVVHHPGALGLHSVFQTGHCTNNFCRHHHRIFRQDPSHCLSEVWGGERAIVDKEVSVSWQHPVKVQMIFHHNLLPFHIYYKQIFHNLIQLCDRLIISNLQQHSDNTTTSRVEDSLTSVRILIMQGCIFFQIFKLFSTQTFLSMNILPQFFLIQKQPRPPRINFKQLYKKILKLYCQNRIARGMRVMLSL